MNDEAENGIFFIRIH